MKFFCNSNSAQYERNRRFRQLTFDNWRSLQRNGAGEEPLRHRNGIEAEVTERKENSGGRVPEEPFRQKKFGPSRREGPGRVPEEPFRNYRTWPRVGPTGADPRLALGVPEEPLWCLMSQSGSERVPRP